LSQYTFGKLFEKFILKKNSIMSKNPKEQNNEQIMNEELKSDAAHSIDKTESIEDNQNQETIEDSSSNNGEPTDKLKAELAELNDKYIRLYSEFDNYKRRNSKERIELLQTASKEVILAMLPILDDFERAEKSMKSATDIQAIKEGVTLIHHKFQSILNAKGLKAIETIGKEFDVDYHEALTKIPAPSEDLKGKVVDELEKGYTLNEKIIRFAKVVIGE
jgi:molecular chaperone GrpE